MLLRRGEKAVSLKHIRRRIQSVRILAEKGQRRTQTGRRCEGVVWYTPEGLRQTKEAICVFTHDLFSRSTLHLQRF